MLRWSESMPTETEFRDIPGWPGYRINAHGAIQSFKSGQWRDRKTSVGVNGYVKVNLSFNSIVSHLSVHTLVLLAFVGPCPPGFEGCHGDGDRRNNRLDNLRWATQIENMVDRDTHGRTARGSSHSNSKLNELKVSEIRRLHARGVPIRQLARSYHVDRKAISLLVKRKTWKHVRAEEFAA